MLHALYLGLILLSIGVSMDYNIATVTRRLLGVALLALVGILVPSIDALAAGGVIGAQVLLLVFVVAPGVGLALIFTGSGA
jgi:hypothetical protein